MGVTAHGIVYSDSTDPPNHWEADQAQADSIEALIGAPLTPHVMNVYTANNTWTKPVAPAPIPKSVRVRVIGGGGGGGGAAQTAAGQASAGGGGAGGNYGESILDVSTLAATVAVTVGAGGTGVAGGTGNTGGTSSFGAHVSATGGGGGVGGAASSTFPGGSNGGGAALTVTGQIQAAGDAGGFGLRLSAGACVGGQGGGTPLGGGAQSTSGLAGGSVGNVGRNFGGGGGGAFNTAAQGTDRAGGAGAPGVVVVEELY